MLSKKDCERIWEGVQANAKALRECEGPHVFEDVTPDKRIGKDYRCTRCGGVLSSINKHWYEQGLADAKKLPVQTELAQPSEG